MKQYIEVYNKFLDTAQGYLDATSKALDIKGNLAKINNSQFVRDIRNDPNVDEVIRMIERSNHYQDNMVRFTNGWGFDFPYSRRRMIVLTFLGFDTLFMLLRRLKARNVLNHYIFWSALICRENFNLKIYKLKYT
jgi:hypothetical protein